MWPDHPLGRDIAGTEQSGARLTRDDILEYADAHYRLPNLVIGAAGAVGQEEILQAGPGRPGAPPRPERRLVPIAPQPLPLPPVLLPPPEEAHGATSPVQHHAVYLY